MRVAFGAKYNVTPLPPQPWERAGNKVLDWVVADDFFADSTLSSKLARTLREDLTFVRFIAAICRGQLIRTAKQEFAKLEPDVPAVARTKSVLSEGKRVTVVEIRTGPDWHAMPEYIPGFGELEVVHNRAGRQRLQDEMKADLQESNKPW